MGNRSAPFGATRGRFLWNGIVGFGVGRRRAFKVGIGQIVQRYRDVQAQQVMHPIEQGALDDVPLLHQRIRSLIDLREILLGCNRHYLEFLSSLDDHSDGQRTLQKLTEPKTVKKITWRGFNFFAATDQALLRAVLNPKFNIHGLRGADLKPYLPNLPDSSLSRQIKRLHIFGMIKRVPGTYRYYLTKLDRAAIAACVHATEFTILPTLATTA